MNPDIIRKALWDEPVHISFEVYKEVMRGYSAKEKYKIATDLLQSKFHLYVDLQAELGIQKAEASKQFALAHKESSYEYEREIAYNRQIQAENSSQDLSRQLFVLEVELNTLNSMIDDFDPSAKEEMTQEDFIAQSIVEMYASQQERLTGISAYDISTVIRWSVGLGDIKLPNTSTLLDTAISPEVMASILKKE